MKTIKTIGSRAQVWHGTAKKTSGGLTKKDLKKNKYGKIVSKKMSNRAKKEKRLEKAGYKTKKGKFKLFKKKKGRRKQKGGENSNETNGNSVNTARAVTRRNAALADGLRHVSSFLTAKNIGAMHEALGSAKRTKTAKVIKRRGKMNINHALKRNIGKWVNSNGRIDKDGIMQAVREENVPAVETLIYLGGDVNYVDEQGMTALGVASDSYKPNAEIVETLLKAGANVNHKNHHGNTALMLAVDINEPNAGIVHKLINADADVNYENDDGDTALMMAVSAYEPNAEIVQKLIDAGAHKKIDHENRMGDTALTLAVISQNAEIVQKLIDAGADVNRIDNYGSSALTWAIIKKNAEIIDLLINAGASINSMTVKARKRLNQIRKSTGIHNVN